MTDKVLLKKIGLRIKEVRTLKGLSQQELAALIEYEKSNMSRIESGNINPTILTLNKIAKALDVSLSELLQIK